MKEEKNRASSYVRDTMFSGIVIILLIIIMILMIILNAFKKYGIETSVPSTATSYQLIETTTSTDASQSSEDPSDITIVTTTSVSSAVTESNKIEQTETTETSTQGTTTHTTKTEAASGSSSKVSNLKKESSSQNEKASSLSSAKETTKPSEKAHTTKGTSQTKGTSESTSKTPGNSVNGEEKSGRFNKTEAKKLLDLVNEYRESCGVSKLKWSDSLGKAARTRAKETSVTTKSQNKHHTRPNGEEWYSVNPDIMYGENLAFGQKSAKEVFEAYKNSTAHRKTMLDPEYKTFGAGFYIKENTAYMYYWVQEFGY